LPKNHRNWLNKLIKHNLFIEFIEFVVFIELFVASYKAVKLKAQSKKFKGDILLNKLLDLVIANPRA
jgi:hypothetical protein